MEAETLLEDSDIVKVAEKVLTAFIEARKLRKTPERFVILEEIYSRKDHFDAESLYISIRNKKYRISRATIYNTLELLSSCGLVIKHFFGKNKVQFERSYGYKKHNHIVCTDCGRILNFRDRNIEKISERVEAMGFEIQNHSLTFYVKCSDYQAGCSEFCARCQRDKKELLEEID